MIPQSLQQNMKEPTVECPACRGAQWSIYLHRISCARCGLSYFIPNLFAVQTALMSETVPSKEVLESLKIVDSIE